MKKILLGLVVVLLVAGGGGAWWLYSQRDTLIADAIRTHAPQILGVPVKLGSVKTDPATQSASLHGLVIGNPPGFATPHALSLDAVSVKLDLASLTKDVILIREIALVKPDINYERKAGGSNLDVIQRNAEQYAAGRGGGDAKKDAGAREPGKKLVIENFYLREARAAVSAELLQGKSVAVPVPDLHLTDIGKKSNGASAGEATRQIMGALTASVTRAGGSALGGLPEDAKKGAGAVGGALKGLFK